MPVPKLILLVKFKSTLPMDEVVEVANSRADDFRALPGLIQKYYVQDSETGEIGGLYLWDSPEALAAYRDSDLRATIAKAYKTEGDPHVQVMKVLMPLRQG